MKLDREKENKRPKLIFKQMKGEIIMLETDY